MLLACIAQAMPQPVVIRDHDALALSPAGDRVADVEALDPGNLPEEAHGAVVVHAADGKAIATYDPCKTCKYSDTAWSPAGDKLAFLATDWMAGKTTLHVVEKGVVRTATTIVGVANSVRWSPDGARIALLATPGAHKKTGAVEAGAAQVGEIGISEDEQRIAIVSAAGGDLRLVSPADTYIYEYDWARDGRGFVATAAKGNGDNNWWIATLDYVDAGTGALRLIAAPHLQMNLPRVSPDGKQVAFVGGLMSDWGSIGGDVYLVPLEGGTPQDISPDFKGSFRGIAWRGQDRSGRRADRRSQRSRGAQPGLARAAHGVVRAGWRSCADLRWCDRVQPRRARYRPRSARISPTRRKLRWAIRRISSPSRMTTTCWARMSRRAVCTGRTKASRCKAGCSGRSRWPATPSIRWWSSSTAAQVRL